MTRRKSQSGYEKQKAQLLLATHLKELGLCPVVFEFHFAEGRRFRADLAVPSESLLFECDGHFQGKHGQGWGAGHEKINLAQALGFRCFQFSNRDILTGKALEWLKTHLITTRVIPQSTD